MGSAGEQASVGDLVVADGPHPRSREGRDRHGLAVQRDKLDFVRLALGIDMDNGSDIAGFQVFGVEVGGENDAVVFFDHRGGPLDRKGDDRPQERTSLFEKANDASTGLAAVPVHGSG